MNSRPTIQQELKELSSLLPHDIEQPVFTVPEGYFENFAASVWQKLRSQQPQTPHDELTELSSVLAAIPKKNPYTVPENYFSGFTRAVPSLVKEDELPQALQSLDRQMPYAVPAGYFNSLADTVLAKVTRPQAKVVRFQPARIMRIAAAAMVAGVIAISGIVYFSNGSSTADPNPQSEEWVAKKLKDVSNQALEEFILTVDAGAENSSSLAQNGNRQADVRTMLKDVPNDELEAFLEQVPTAYDDFDLMN